MDWININGWEGIYMINRKGDVLSLKRAVKRKDGRINNVPDRILKPSLSARGYLTVNLCSNRKFKTKTIHLLLAQHFIENNENKKTVNHKDGNKLNNDLRNLEWATYSENNKHAYRIGLKKGVSRYSKMNGHSKKIKQKTISGKLIRIWDCARDADRCGLSYTSISACLRGKQKTYSNSIWEYA